MSCAPVNTSGPLPAAFAVTRAVWNSPDTTWTATLMPLSAAKSSANARTGSAFKLSVQITRSASARSGAAVDPAAAGEDLAGWFASVAFPHPVSSSIAVAVTAIAP
ncbi:hypothetical protein D9M72_586860 [compost metagenome]